MYLIYVHIPALSNRVCIEKPQIENCSQFSTDAGKEMLYLAEIFISKKTSKTKHILYACTQRWVFDRKYFYVLKLC